jgi:hypothetical protein
MIHLGERQRLLGFVQPADGGTAEVIWCPRSATQMIHGWFLPVNYRTIFKAFFSVRTTVNIIPTAMNATAVGCTVA